MNYSLFDFLTLIGSLGLFLYGMKLMSEGLQKVAGNSLRSILTAMTKNRFIGLTTGVLITALIQSSSATTVMVVSFVNAGLLYLAQAISVIMGANIGTTVTAWIISLLGFKVSMAALSIPIIAFSIPFIFSSHNKRKSFGEFLIGFALLFMGLELLKGSVPDLQNNPDMLAFLQQYTHFGYGSVLLFLLIGSILTVVVQSSSATMAITLIMCSKGWISYELAAAMVLGENIGTTITANIAAIPANVSAKRAALSHLMFNVFGVIWVMALFYPFLSLVKHTVEMLGMGDPDQLAHLMNTTDPATLSLIADNKAVLTPEVQAVKDSIMSAQVATSFGISMFHTLFNIINSFILVWCVKLIEKTVVLLIPQKKTDEEFRLAYISSGLLSTSELSILQAEKEILVYANRSVRMFTIVKELYKAKDSKEIERLYQRAEKYEEISDRMEVEIANYLTKVSEGKLSDFSKQNVHALLRVVSEIESIDDACFNLARIIMRKYNDNIPYSDQLDKNVENMFFLVQNALDEMFKVLNERVMERRMSDIRLSLKLEDEINLARNEYKMQNASDVKNQKYPYSVSVTYMDMISECEKIGDYVLNVVEQYQETKAVEA